MKRLRYLVLVTFGLFIGLLIGLVSSNQVDFILLVFGNVNYLSTIYLSIRLEKKKWKTLILSYIGIICILPQLMGGYLSFLILPYFVLMVDLLYRTRKTLS
jgi:hypothetical protein